MTQWFWTMCILYMHVFVFFLVQAIFFGGVALMTLRMKFFWMPYMCIIASVSLANKSLWAWLFSHLRFHSELLVCVKDVTYLLTM